MPSWDTASTRKVLDENQKEEPEDVELNHLDPVTAHDATAPLVSNQAAPSRGGYGQLANPHTPTTPNTPYYAPHAGGDLGQQTPYRQQSYGVTQARPQQSYGGGVPQQSYSNAYSQQQQPAFSAYGSSYASSESTRFEPYRHQETGTTYVGSSWPPQRRPVGNGGGWREV